MTLRQTERAIVGLLLAAACYRGVNAQTGDVYGVVTDSLTKQRIPLANVTVVGTNRGAASNNVGFYYIPKLPPGTYELAASVIGYRTVTRRVALSEGKSVELDFQLPASSLQVQEVVVSAPRRPLETELKTSVHILEQQELKAVPATVQADVLQALKILPGIVSTSDVSSKFYVRGGAADQNLFLYDGIRVFYPFHALGIFSVFNPNVANSVEVYTAAFPPAYGDRLSSVVNILTRDGRADRISASADINFLSAEAEAEGPLSENATWLLDGRKSVSSHTFSKIIGLNTPVSFYDGTFKVSARPGGASKADLTVLSSGDNLLSSSPTDPDYHWKNNGIALSVWSLPAERVFIQWLVYGSIYSANRNPKASATITSASTTVQYFGMRSSATVYTGPKDIYDFGFEFDVPKMDYSFVNRMAVPQTLASSLLEVSTWGRYIVQLDKARWDLGLHLDLTSLFGGEKVLDGLQPRLRMSYDIGGMWSETMSYGHFTQKMVTVGNEDDVISIFDGWIQVPKNIPPESADHFVLGFSGPIGNQMSLSLEGYYKSYASLVQYNWNKTNVEDPDYIQGTGHSYGAELMLRAKVFWVDLYGAYSFSIASVFNGGITYFPRYDRRHHLNLMAVAHPLKGLSATVRWEYGSGFPYTQTVGYAERITLDNSLPGRFEFETGTPYMLLGSKNAARLPPYDRLDASVSYDFRFLGLDVSVGADILNVYNSDNIFYVDRNTGRIVTMLPFYPSAMMTVKY